MGLALFEITVEISRVAGQPPALELDDDPGHPVQEMAVMGDDYKSPRVPGEEFLKPGHRLNIQVVGRLIEQKQIGLGEKQPSQRRPHPPATRKFAERLLDFIA